MPAIEGEGQRFMGEQFTNAEQMARQAGLSNGKTFRARLRAKLPQFHEHGRWRVLIGSVKHQAMEQELKVLLAGRS